jgi:hypothetical protein
LEDHMPVISLIYSDDKLRYASAYAYVYGNFSWWLTWLDSRVYESI